MAWQAAVGEALGAVGSAVGGYFGQKSAEKSANKMYRRQAADNKEILQNQVQWRVEDTVKAGLHPLAALGVNPASGPVGQTVGDNGWRERFGSNIGRAAEAMMAPSDKASSRMMELSVQRGELENELLKSQIASQRMRNMQQGTPGVNDPAAAAAAGGGVANIPGLPAPWQVTNPTLGTQLENAYQEWSNILLIPAMANDAIKYLGLESLLLGANRIPTPSEAGYAAGKKVREWFVEDAEGNRYK